MRPLTFADREDEYVIFFDPDELAQANLTKEAKS